MKVNRIVEDAIAITSEKIQGYGIDLEFSSTDDDLEIECQETQICQVLVNLLSNSCDAIKDAEDLREKWIRLNVSDLGNSIEFSVIDSGKGIPEEIRDKIMEPFFTTKGSRKGTGLGTQICRSVAESHQGYFKLNADCLNTCFVFGIPKEHADHKQQAA